MVKKELKVLFCERFNCVAEDYEKRMFRRCLYWHARWMIPIARRSNAKYFDEDFNLVRELGYVIDFRQATFEIRAYQIANRQKKNILRNILRIRVSGMKAADLAKKLFSQEQKNSS